VVNATPPEQDRQQRWNIERQRILAARAKVEREAAEAGEVLVHCLPEPEAAVPDWYGADDSGPPRIEHARSSEPSDTITLPYGPLGRPPAAGAGELTPEQHFAKAARRETVRRWTGIELPS
jgi:hypothetical protein